MDKEKDHINRFLEGKYSEEVIRKVLDDISNGTNIVLYDEYLKKKWEFAALDENTPEEEKQFLEESEILIEKLDKQHTLRKWRKPLIGIAASVAILFGSSIYLNKFMSFEKEVSVALLNDSAGIGQIKKINLPDGTITTLNACAQIFYPEKFEGDYRRITLKGEAYFKVAQDKNHPFVIHTEHFDVRVLGTEFNVKAYEEDEILTINVESGKVQVDMPEAVIRLTANEKLVINTRDNKYSKEIDNTKIAVWRSGHLLFDKTPIREVAHELERVYNCKITFKKGQNFDNLISGEHTNKSLESVLESIKHTTGLQYDIDSLNFNIVFYKQ